MAERPLISVIVPVYNIIEYLPRCVHSITDQTYGNLELLLVDDGSTDGTGELCDRLAAEDGRIRVFHKENGGSSSARNLGISQAKGEYLGFVDSDDYVEPDMYERLYQGIIEFGVKAAQIGRDEIDEQGHRLPNICEPPKEPVCYEDGDFLRELLMHRGDCSFCTKLLRRELFAGENFPEGRLNEDFYLLVRMLPRIGRLVSLPEQAYHVFYRIGSNSRKADRENFSRVYGDSVDNADMVAAIVDREYPDLRTVALRFGVFQRLEYLLHIPISRMRRDNTQYRAIVKWLRRMWTRGMTNALLTGKNKAYHTIFAIAPRGARKFHRFLRKKS
ncbi:MAG: glycosyltransferase family 2 protein [Acetatifactor sp.]|nr:glycosyltransferase family 2 protein [Acetatifactor sp.]